MSLDRFALLFIPRAAASTQRRPVVTALISALRPGLDACVLPPMYEHEADAFLSSLFSGVKDSVALIDSEEQPEKLLEFVVERWLPTVPSDKAAVIFAEDDSAYEFLDASEKLAEGSRAAGISVCSLGSAFAAHEQLTPVLDFLFPNQMDDADAEEALPAVEIQPETTGDLTETPAAQFQELLDNVDEETATKEESESDSAAATTKDPAEIIESKMPENIYRPKGVLCSTREELLMAYRELGGGKVFVKHVGAPMEAGMVVSSAAEMELLETAMLTYGTTRGNAAVFKNFAKDIDVVSGIDMSPIGVFVEGRCIGLLDHVNIGNKTIAGRRAAVSKDLSQHRSKLIKATDVIASQLKKATDVRMGCVNFAVAKGKIFVVDVSAHSLNMDVCTSLMLQRIVGSGRSVWNSSMVFPHQSLNLETAIHRLKKAGIAFSRSSKVVKGVLPVSWVPGFTFHLFSFGENADDDLHKAEDCLQQPPEDGADDALEGEPRDAMGIFTDAELAEISESIEHKSGDALFSEKHRRIFVQSTHPAYRRETQRMNLACRSIMLVRPGDLCILPGEYPFIRDFAQFAADLLGLDHDATFIFTPGTALCMDNEIEAPLVADLTKRIESSGIPLDKWMFVPYQAHERFLLWAKDLLSRGVALIGESPEWLRKYGDKSILHRFMHSLDTPSVAEEIDAGRGIFRVPGGYIAKNTEELLAAWDLLAMPRAVVKPVLGAAGEGIIFVHSKEELEAYNFPMGDVALEEMLDLDAAADGVITAPALHYFKDKPLQGLCDQLMVGTSYVGWRPTTASEDFLKDASAQADLFLKVAKPEGAGGFDFLSQNGLPYLTDINTGRFNGAHFPKIVQAMYAPSAAWYCWKIKTPQGILVDQIWSQLKARNIAFEPGVNSRGVLPLVWCPGFMCQMIAFGRDDIDAKSLRLWTNDIVENVVEQMQQKQRALEKGGEEAPAAPTSLTVDPTLGGAEFPHFIGMTKDEENPPPAIVYPKQMDMPADPIGVPAVSGLLLIRDVQNIYTPNLVQNRAVKHILIGGSKILGFLETEDADVIQPRCEVVIDGSGLVAVPGLVDIHTHLMGGGGEAGPQSRTPEAKSAELFNAGLTTVVGLLGTDSVSKNPKSLLFKCRALEAEGVSTYMFTGAYKLPPPTITETVIDDITVVEKVVGVGEIAISDRRASTRQAERLAELSAEVYTAGLLAGRGGLVYLHVGPGKTLLDPVREVIATTDLPITTFLPTHMQRTRHHIEDAKKWIREGGNADFTASISACTAITEIWYDGLPMSHVCLSSDAYGSNPAFDAQGQIIRYTYCDPRSLHLSLKRLVFDNDFPLQRALKLVTSNPARFLKIKKGVLEVGSDADVCLLDAKTLDIKLVVAMGQVVKRGSWVKTGFFG